MELHKIGTQDYISYNNQDEATTQKNQKEARKILRNKFNYQEVEMQSRIKVIREIGVSTSNPFLQNFSSEVN